MHSKIRCTLVNGPSCEPHDLRRDGGFILGGKATMTMRCVRPRLKAISGVQASMALIAAGPLTTD
ncbi:hypothetical protein Tamer19_07160 [Cupriavidus sp. TA19]|nr:hypothetical protein Tamer19_07160 [Cupriavidus sp. TA19]